MCSVRGPDLPETLLTGDKKAGVIELKLHDDKGDLELWFVQNNTTWLYIKIIIVTAWVVIFPSSNIADKAFVGIPRLPESLI